MCEYTMYMRELWGWGMYCCRSLKLYRGCRSSLDLPTHRHLTVDYSSISYSSHPFPLMCFILHMFCMCSYMCFCLGLHGDFVFCVQCNTLMQLILNVNMSSLKSSASLKLLRSLVDCIT